MSCATCGTTTHHATWCDRNVPPEKPERWVLTLIVDREENEATPPIRLAPGEKVSPPDSWAWSGMIGARVEIVGAARLEPGDSIRTELDGDACWLELDEDGEVNW